MYWVGSNTNYSIDSGYGGAAGVKVFYRHGGQSELASFDSVYVGGYISIY